MVECAIGVLFAGILDMVECAIGVLIFVGTGIHPVLG
jgi:hypothetical protein